MTFADLKNDFVFRRIFAAHPNILRGLLNDLLERTGGETITSIEYLPSEQLPLVVGAKLSILDVRCKSAGIDVIPPPRVRGLERSFAPKMGMIIAARIELAAVVPVEQEQ